MVTTTRSGPINGDASGSGDQQQQQQQQQQQPDIMNQFAQLLQNLTATVQLAQPRGPPPRSSIFSEFRRQRPPVFSGEPDPQVANRWIRQIKKMLETMDVRANIDKIALATYQLEGEADHWISNQQKAISGGPIRNNNNKVVVNKKPYDRQLQNRTWGYQNSAGGNQYSQWKSTDQYGNPKVCWGCGQEGHTRPRCPNAGTGYQGPTGYYQQGQGYSQRPQQQQFTQQKLNQPPPAKSFGGKQPQYQNRGKQQPAAKGRVFALQEEEDADPSAIQEILNPQ
ncbi:hypothetical protein Vadar_004230 [Vaccinium darrowii]|uniref:Uncharacterized protein n=1 Tax=Vaccinium darrowii TaxID=229202 RepID=A0ACB7Z334_9ERIC|nr:hypothetical protein Vadar_004230 [Vaccinium darrowii]